MSENNEQKKPDLVIIQPDGTELEFSGWMNIKTPYIECDHITISAFNVIRGIKIYLDEYCIPG